MNSCKICSSGSFRHIGKPVINSRFPKGHEKDYAIKQCCGCGFYFVDPEIDLTQGEWRLLYEDDYFAGTDLTAWHKKMRTNERSLRLRLISNALTIEKGKFLDIGCGEGNMLNDAAACGYRPAGLDIACNLNEAASKHEFFKGNIFEAAFADDTFSVVYMDSVLEHVTDPVETLAELKRILKPGGVLFIVVPNEDSFENGFIRIAYAITGKKERYGKIKPFVTPYHIQGFNAVSLKRAIDNCGMRNINIRGFGGSYPFWRAYRLGSRAFFQSLLTYPVGLASVPFGRQIQLMAISVK